MKSEELGILLRRLGLQGVVQRNQNWMACCPNHGETRPSWGISVDHPHVHACFACGYKGTLRTLLVYKFGKTNAFADSILGYREVTSADFHFDVSGRSKPQAESTAVSEEEFLAYHAEPKSTAYAASRGLSLDTIISAELAYHREHRRVLFPWYYQGEFYGATGRTLINQEKIVVYFGLRKGKMMYVPKRHIEPESIVILVEGEIDALKVQQALPECSVAALSFAKFTKTQEEILLKQSPSEVALYFDDDFAGRRFTKEVHERLAGLVPKLTVVPYLQSSESKTDPGALDDKQNRANFARRKVPVLWPKIGL